MKKYTFILRVEIAETVEGYTEEQARARLAEEEECWMVTRSNGQVLKVWPTVDGRVYSYSKPLDFEDK